ncbi:hypothetical protein EHP00_1964 [Ecytonucleospora hepatopenaei]|uniref:ABC transporter domain-containing protein n=1 Tax=Ecytonucleospora hepatopenaei TaxID=646526 RepID=A0A1W0E6X1_9MICR|nr:hypothetical protein EHP00_1964 [Ecytonucleospora hepatopenaei]
MNRFVRNSFLIKQVKSRRKYTLPSNYKVIFEADINGCMQRIEAYKGESILLTGSNGAGKTQLLLSLFNDYKAQVILEDLSNINNSNITYNDNINNSNITNNDNNINNSNITYNTNTINTILLTHDEFLSVISFLDQEHNIMPGTIYDNLFINNNISNTNISNTNNTNNTNILNNIYIKYPILYNKLHKYITGNYYFYNDTTPYHIKKDICLLRALYLAEHRDILLLDGVDIEYVEEILKSNRDKVILMVISNSSNTNTNILYNDNNSNILYNDNNIYNLFTKTYNIKNKE